MDNWSIVVGGVAVGLVALYFSPTIDYIKNMTNDDELRLQRLKARQTLGLFELLDKYDIQEYIAKHPSMSQVLNLLKTAGNYVSTPPPLSPSSSTAPKSPSFSSVGTVGKGSLPISTNNDLFEGITKFLPTQLQFDLFVLDLVSILKIGSPNDKVTNGTNENLFWTFLETNNDNNPQFEPSTHSNALVSHISQSLLLSDTLHLSLTHETIEQLHRLYLLSLRCDGHPDYKLQAFYDLYSSSTGLVTNSSISDGGNNNIDGDNLNRVESIIIDHKHHPSSKKEETIVWVPLSSSLNLSNQRANDGLDELSSLENRQEKSDLNNHQIDNLEIIVPQSTSLQSSIDNPIPVVSSDNDLDSIGHQKEITYLSVYNAIDELYHITTLSVLFEHIKKIKVLHSIEWHEECLKILWNYAPLYDKDNNKNTNIDNDIQNDSNTEFTRKHLPYQQITDKWGDVGFQGRDPCTDFRGCGLFGLLVLTAFAIEYPDEYSTYIIAQQERGVGIYGLAITSINVTAVLVEYCHAHILAPIFLQYGSSFSTFLKLHRLILHLLWVEWNNRTGKYNIAMGFSIEQKHRGGAASSPSASPISPPSSTDGALGLQKGITIMDFPHVFKDVLILFKKLIYQGQIKFE
jgi:hypothetical protein